MKQWAGPEVRPNEFMSTDLPKVQVSFFDLSPDAILSFPLHPAGRVGVRIVYFWQRHQSHDGDLRAQRGRTIRWMPATGQRRIGRGSGL
jgi:hypothetical protein